MILARIRIGSLAAIALAATMAQAGAPESQEPKTPARVDPPEAVSPASTLSGRITWGTGGALRLVLAGNQRRRSANGEGLQVEILNVGTEEFTVQRDDAWGIVTQRGEQIVLRPRDRRRIRILSHESATVDLSAPDGSEGEIAALTYRSAGLEREVQIATPYTPPSPRLVAPAVYDLDLLPLEQSIEVSAWVAADGRVEAVFGPSKGRSRLVEAARHALEQWVLSPAMDDGVPSPALYKTTFHFGQPLASRAVFPIPAGELEARLSKILAASFPIVVPLPSVQGFVVAARPKEDVGLLVSVPVFLIRIGEEPGTGRTWVAVRQKTRVKKAQGSPCDCAWWSGEGQGTVGLLRWMAKQLDVATTGESALTCAHPPAAQIAIPSGLVEPPGAGAWKLGTIASFLDESLDSDFVAATTKFPLGESEILHGPPSGEPLLIMGDVIAPRLLQKVKPQFPERLRVERGGGRVILQAVIDPQGNVRDVDVLQATHRDCEEAAVEAVCCWKYAPATLEGRPVAVYLTVVVEFSIQ